MVVGEKVDGEGEERKEIEARLHFAGIARSRLACLDIMSAARDTRRFDQPPSSQSTLRAFVPLVAAIAPRPTMASARSLMRLSSGRSVASAARSNASRTFSSSSLRYAAKASTQPGAPEPENMRQAQRPRMWMTLAMSCRRNWTN